LTELAWQSFEDADYPTALSLFYGALAVDLEYSEAHCGLGWSWLGLQSFHSSLASFNMALSGGFRTPQAFAGKVMAISWLLARSACDSSAMLDTAAVAGDSVLARQLRFVFTHDTEVDWKDLRVILAERWHRAAIYDSAAAQVESLGGLVPEHASPLFALRLGREIDRLADETSPDSARQVLAANWKLWLAQTMSSYEYELRIASFYCSSDAARIDVREGIIDGILNARTGSPFGGDQEACFRYTIEDLLFNTHQWLYWADLNRNPGSVRVDYDLVLGYPRKISLPYGEPVTYFARLLE